MAKRTVYLHLGFRDSGAAAIDAALLHHRERLGAYGVRTPLRDAAHTRRAALDLRGDHEEHGLRRRDVAGRWADLARAATARGAGHQHVALGHDSLGVLDDGQAALLVDHLAGTRVHAVLVVTDPASTIVRGWAREVAAGGTVSLRRYARRLLDPARERRVAREFWAEHDVPRVLERWAHVLGDPERVHVVVAPAADREQVAWEAYSRLLGLDAEALPLPGPDERDPDLDLPAPDVDPAALDAAALATLRAVNRALEGRLDQAARRALVGEHVLRAEAAASGPRPVCLPETTAEAVADLAATWRAALVDGGYDVLGDLDALTPAPVERGQQADDVKAGHRLASTTDTLADVLTALGAERAETARLRRELDAVSARRTA